VSSSANDDDCKSAAFYQQYKVAVFVVLNDFKSTSNFLNPHTFKFAFGPRGCSSNSITSLLAEVPSDNTYRINESQVERFGFMPLVVRHGCPSRTSVNVVS
jgi:hypothetical protein